MRLTTIVLGVLFAIIADWIYNRRMERFTVHLEDKPQCISPTNATTGSINVPLSPPGGAVRWTVSGYNYQDTPIFYRDGKKIVPLEYAWNSDGMTYYFTLASEGESGCAGSERSPEGTPTPEGRSAWVLSTFDHVQPTVTDQDTLRELVVTPIRRRHGFNLWSVSCTA